jgi:DNA-binding SARP family transcriptional activator
MNDNPSIIGVSMAELSIRLFGHPEMSLGETPATVDTRKAVALLAYLAVTGHGHSREALAGLLWPDYDHPNARAALRRTLSALNKAIGPAHLDSGWDMITLNRSAPLQVDVAEFRARLAECASHGHSANEVCVKCVPLLQTAANLYRGDFMEGFSLRDSAPFDEWQFLEAEALRHELSTALELLAGGLSQQGQFEAAIAAARRWLGLDTLREEAHRQLMLLYARSGQHGAALRQYRECVRVLEQELGVPPLDETTRLYREILGQRAPLSLEVKPQPALTEGPSLLIPANMARLVGRAVEWSALQQALESGSGRFVALVGEAGIGKSWLCGVFAEHARQAGAAVLVGRCYPGEKNLIYSPFLDAIRSRLAQARGRNPLKDLPSPWLNEAAWLLPELAALAPGTPERTALEGPAAQSRFFEGLRQVLIALTRGPVTGLLLLDDLHLADAATLDFLTYLVRRLASQTLLVVGAWCDDGSPAAQRLANLVAENNHSGIGKLLTLKRFSPAEAAQMAVNTAGKEGLPEALLTRLETEAEGLPFFIAEYLSAYREGKLVDPGGEWVLPHGVRDLLHTRLAAVGETGQQLLATAAVIGRSFDLDSLQIASGRSEEETITGLEALVAHGLILEERSTPGAGSQGRLRYDFFHEKLRALVYEETSLARRRLLHRRVAEALAGQGHDPQSNEMLASQIARHYQLAGQEGMAAEYFVTAGEHARRLHANSEAITHFQAALALGYPRIADLREAIGDLQTLQGDYAAALESYETAASQTCGECQPRLEHKLGKVHARRGAWEMAEIHFNTALSALSEDSAPGLCSQIYADFSQITFQRGQVDLAQKYAELARVLAENAADQPALAQSFNILGILARSHGDLAAAREYLQSGLAVAEQTNLIAERIAALNNLALVQSDLGDHPDAIRKAQLALELCVEIGDRHHEAALRDHLADFYHTLGQAPAAMEQLEKAVTIFTEVGMENGQSRPEIWKLSEW